MTRAEELSESLEDYLEAIFHIIEENRPVRAKDIGERLGVSRPSVTRALHNLQGRGLIHHDPYGAISLTRKGRAWAEGVARRHQALTDFFCTVLKVDVKEAGEAACRMEHAVSDHVLERLIHFVEFVQACPVTGARWVEGVGYRCDGHRNGKRCEKCMDQCLRDLQKRSAARKPGRGVAKEGAAMSLSDVETGRRVRIVSVPRRGKVHRRIAEMGVLPGAVVKVVRLAPLGDPIELHLKGYRLSLRMSEAADIRVEKA